MSLPQFDRRSGLILLILVIVGVAIAAISLTRRSDGRSGQSRGVGRGDGGGTAAITPSEPVTVGSRGTWTITYVVGPDSIGEGGGVVAHLPIFWEWAEPQMATPEVPGYSTVSCSRSDLRIESHAVGPHHYIRSTVAEGSLFPGDTLRFIYGDTKDSAFPNAQARADLYSERGQEFLVKVDGDGDGFFVEIERSPRLDIVAGPAADLRIHVKGEAQLNDTTYVTVAALDRFGNRAVGYRGTIRFSHRWDVHGAPTSYTMTAEDRGARAFPIRFASPGFSTLGVVEEGGTMKASSNPIRVRGPGEDDPFRLLWGDLHIHSQVSDGTGTPEENYRFGRDVANLDVIALTDHDHHGLRPLREKDWEAIRRLNEEFYQPGRLVTFLGYEWTNWVYGHRNVYFRNPEAGVLHSTADSSSNSPPELWNALPNEEAMTIAHHTGGGPIPTDWSIVPPPARERLVEISSIHGSSECLGCPKEIYSPVPGTFVRDALARGYRLGLIGSGDGHVGHPGITLTPSGGLAGIYAAATTREAVWEALLARRTYATSGERIILSVRIADHWMGEEIQADDLPEGLPFEVDICGTAPVDLVELIADGVAVDTLFGNGERVEGTLETSKNPNESTYYYVRVRQMDGGLAWSSPIWIDP